MFCIRAANDPWCSTFWDCTIRHEDSVGINRSILLVQLPTWALRPKKTVPPNRPPQRLQWGRAVQSPCYNIPAQGPMETCSGLHLPMFEFISMFFIIRWLTWQGYIVPTLGHSVLKITLTLIEFVEGSLEAKLPTIWTDEKQSREEAERRDSSEEKRSEERRCRCAKR